MTEQLATVGDITLCYETFGDREDPAVLLIMGLDTQMIAWDEAFCSALAERGFFVVRYDNRDVGRSSRIDGVPPPKPLELMTRRIRNPAYNLDTMAQDAIGLLDVLGLDAAHVVGASMGGMIAQCLAADHPDRVRTLVSIMSTTGNRWKGQPAPRVLPVLLAKPARTKEESVHRVQAIFRLIGSPGFARDDDALRAQVERAWDRGPSRGGSGRQLAAIIVSGDRTARLASVTAPTLVIHGSADRLIAPSGGRATAAAIPGSRLMMVEGMGHDLPPGAWPRLLDAIESHAKGVPSLSPA